MNLKRVKPSVPERRDSGGCRGLYSPLPLSSAVCWSSHSVGLVQFLASQVRLVEGSCTSPLEDTCICVLVLILGAEWLCHELAGKPLVALLPAPHDEARARLSPALLLSSALRPWWGPGPAPASHGLPVTECVECLLVCSGLLRLL